MKIPHPFKKAEENREKMRHEAQRQWQAFDSQKHKSPVNTKIIWFVLIGFTIMVCLKMLSVWIGG